MSRLPKSKQSETSELCSFLRQHRRVPEEHSFQEVYERQRLSMSERDGGNIWAVVMVRSGAISDPAEYL